MLKGRCELRMARALDANDGPAFGRALDRARHVAEVLMREMSPRRQALMNCGCRECREKAARPAPSIQAADALFAKGYSAGGIAVLNAMAAKGLITVETQVLKTSSQTPAMAPIELKSEAELDALITAMKGKAPLN